MKPHEFSYKGWIKASDKNVLVHHSHPQIEIPFSCLNGILSEQTIRNLKNFINLTFSVKMK